MSLAVAQKFHYTNPKILKHAKGQVCQCCGADDGTIVAAHSNQQEHGRGAFLKARETGRAPCLGFAQGVTKCGQITATGNIAMI